MTVARVTHDGTCATCGRRVGCYVPSLSPSHHVYPWRHLTPDGSPCDGTYDLAEDPTPRT